MRARCPPRTVPGEQGWPLGGHILSAKGRDEEERVRNYMKQLREECCTRMLEIFYKESQEVPNKHWMAYSKRKYVSCLCWLAGRRRASRSAPLTYGSAILLRRATQMNILVR